MRDLVDTYREHEEEFWSRDTALLPEREPDIPEVSSLSWQDIMQDTPEGIKARLQMEREEKLERLRLYHEMLRERYPRRVQEDPQDLEPKCFVCGAKPTHIAQAKGITDDKRYSCRSHVVQLQEWAQRWNERNSFFIAFDMLGGK
jgi:hypothetical protein